MSLAGPLEFDRSKNQSTNRSTKKTGFPCHPGYTACTMAFFLASVSYCFARLKIGFSRLCELA